jgi:hypothetical protein
MEYTSYNFCDIYEHKTIIKLREINPEETEIQLSKTLSNLNDEVLIDRFSKEIIGAMHEYLATISKKVFSKTDSHFVRDDFKKFIRENNLKAAEDYISCFIDKHDLNDKYYVSIMVSLKQFRFYDLIYQ